MIRHIVFFRCKDRADIDMVEVGLQLLADNPHARHFEVGRNLKTDAISPDGPDLVVYGEFETPEDLAAFKAHPSYEQSIKVVRPLRDMRIAADFLS